jgi:hypothetical protein
MAKAELSITSTGTGLAAGDYPDEKDLILIEHIANEFRKHIAGLVLRDGWEVVVRLTPPEPVEN